jgi:uncharacterized protein (DUF983 family)
MVKTLSIAGIALLASAKLWAFLTGDLAATMAKAGDDPWGIVALIALYLGMFGFIIVMARFEPNRWITLAVIAATPLVGNMALAGWLAFRGQALFTTRRAV